jgi:cytochrome c-type biogenesis protein CcmH/NrfG
MQSLAQPRFQRFNKKYTLTIILILALLLVFVLWFVSRDNGSDKTKITPQQLRADSYSAYEKGDYKTAAKKFATYVEKAPKDEEALNMLASSYSLIGESEKAIESLKTLQKAQPNDPDILYRLALLSKNLKRASDEVSYLNQLLKIKPDMTEARIILADEYAVQKNYDPAVNQYEKLLAQIPKKNKGRATISIKLGDIYRTKNELLKANKTYKLGLEVDPTNKELKARLAETAR